MAELVCGMRSPEIFIAGEYVLSDSSLTPHAELDLRPASFTVPSTWQLELTKQMRERKG